MSKKLKPGTQFVKKTRDKRDPTKFIEFLMEAQETGRAKKVKRITPYVLPQRRNSRSAFPANSEPVRPTKRINKGFVKEPMFMRLKGSDPVYIAEKYREVEKTVRVNSKTFKVVHKKTAA
ncbi:MAG: hypothetical protein V4490_06820 [Pseudomonadota bacterium]